MDTDISFWFRFINIALAVFVFALCVLKLIWNDQDKARSFRIAGLGFLAIVVAWTAYDLRYTGFHARIPIATIGLIFAALGLRHMSLSPEQFKQSKK